MLASAGGDVEKAGRYFRRAIEADPRYVGARAFDAYNKVFLGQAAGAVTAIEEALRLDRTDRATSIMMFFGGFAQLMLGRHEDAVTWLEKSRTWNPDYGSALLFYAAALALDGQAREAAEVFDAFLNRYPVYTLRTFRRQWLSRSHAPEYQHHIAPLFDQIRQLGLPQ
jgi:tetratricopeptide (TPR) repeat protein